MATKVARIIFSLVSLHLLLTDARMIITGLRTTKAKNAEIMNAITAVLQFSSHDMSILSIGNKDKKYHSPSRGVAVFQVEAQNVSAQQTCFARVTDDVKRLRQTTENVMIVVERDDPVFLATLLNKFLREGVLVWPMRLLVITRLPLIQLQRLHGVLSQTNSVLLIIEDISLHISCLAYAVQPFNHPETKKTLVATWRFPKGLTAHQAPLFSPKFNKFTYKPTLRVTLEQFSLLRVETIEDKTSQSTQHIVADGYMISVLEYVAHGLNFSYMLTRPHDRTWGTKKGTSVTGMVGQVFREEADIGLGPFGIHASRAEVVDFTWPLTIEHASVMAGLGVPEVQQWAFLYPLSTEVWATVLMLLFIVPFVRTLLTRVFGSMEKKFLGNLMDFYGVALRETLRREKELWWWWQRVLVLVWILSTMVLTMSYQGNLMSLMAVRYIRQPFNKMRDILHDKSVSIVWQSDGIYWQYVLDGEAVLFHSIREAEESGRVQFLKLGDLSSAMDAETRLGRKVVVAPDTAIRGLISQHFSISGTCAFYILREEFLPTLLSLITKKNSPLIHGLNIRIISMNEAGLYDYWNKRAIPNISFCLMPPTKISVSTAFSLRTSVAMFVLLASGHGFSVIVFCFEILKLHF